MKTNYYEKPTVSTKLPKISVIGLLGNQNSFVEKKFKNRANFTFVDKCKKSSPVSENQDVVIVAAKFISHALMNAVKNSVGQQTKLIIHHGGMEGLISKLKEFIA